MLLNKLLSIKPKYLYTSAIRGHVWLYRTSSKITTLAQKHEFSFRNVFLYISHSLVNSHLLFFFFWILFEDEHDSLFWCLSSPVLSTFVWTEALHDCWQGHTQLSRNSNNTEKKNASFHPSNCIRNSWIVYYWCDNTSGIWLSNEIHHVQ